MAAGAAGLDEAGQTGHEIDGIAVAKSEGSAHGHSTGSHPADVRFGFEQRLISRGVII